MPRDAVSRTANVGTVGTNGLIIACLDRTILPLYSQEFIHRLAILTLHGPIIRDPLEPLEHHTQYGIEGLKFGPPHLGLQYAKKHIGGPSQIAVRS